MRIQKRLDPLFAPRRTGPKRDCKWTKLPNDWLSFMVHEIVYGRVAADDFGLFQELHCEVRLVVLTEGAFLLMLLYQCALIRTVSSTLNFGSGLSTKRWPNVIHSSA